MKKLSVLLVFVMLVSVFCAAAAQEKSFLERAYDGEFKGTQVIFDGPFVDNDQVFFEESIKPFEEATGTKTLNPPSRCVSKAATLLISLTSRSRVFWATSPRRAT